MPEKTGIALSINLNKIALIRNSREGDYPDLKNFAQRSAQSGVQGITVHPRPDQRHIRPGDVVNLSQICREKDIEFNIEGNPFAAARGSYPGLIALVRQVRPEQCTLVPDSDQQKTSDHGFDLRVDYDRLYPVVKQLKSLGVRVSLFMDPDPEQITLAKKVGADRIELYTGPFAKAYEQGSAEAVFHKHIDAAKKACELDLGVNAGHDLNLKNMTMYKTLPGLREVSIGHALTVDALILGFEHAVKEYLKVCN